MSIEVMSLMFKTPFGSANRKMVAVRLADFADDEGRGIWPSVSTVAQQCELSERTVQRALSDFVEEGILVVVNEGGGRKATRYDFNLSVVRALKNRVQNAAETGEKTRGDTVSPVTGCHPRGDTVSPQGCHGVTLTVKEPSIEPSLERERERDGGEEENLQPAAQPEHPVETSGTASAEAKAEKLKGGDQVQAETREAVEKAFWAFVKDWPGFAGMPKEAAMRAWVKASSEDRKLAAERRDGWFALLKRQGKSHVPAPSTYLNERLFGEVEPVSQAVRAVDPPFGPAWCAERMERLRAVRLAPVMFTAFERSAIASGTLDEAGLRAGKEMNQRRQALGFMDGQASEGKGAAVSESARQTGKGFVPVSRGSEAWVAWQARFEQLGWPWLPDMGRHQVAYFPAGDPAWFQSDVKGEVA